MSGEPNNLGLARKLTNRRLTARANVWRNPDPAGGKRAEVELHELGVPCRPYAPSTPAALQLLADLGAQRSTMLCELAYDADVTEADELRVGDTIYQVERAQRRPNMLLCALWELRT